MKEGRRKRGVKKLERRGWKIERDYRRERRWRSQIG
jgi:hypothetical protein